MAYTTYIDEDGNLTNPPSFENDFTDSPTVPVEGMFTPYTIERGNIWLSKQFGLSDIISVRPIAPSALGESKDIIDGLREEGIRYGALLAAGQQLAKDKGITDVAWVSSVIDQQRDLHGQLYLNSDTEFSMCKLYAAAEDVLSSNLEKQTTLSSAVRNAAQAQQTKFKNEKETACTAAKHAQTQVEVDISEIEGWVDSFKQAKLFIDDLNKRILNMRCDNKGSEGFFDCGYVAETKQYYDDLELFYHNNKPKLVDALYEIHDDITKFIACLNDANDASCKDKKYTKGDVIYTLVPVESTKVTQDGVDKYFAFDFRITGSRDIGNNIKLTFNIKDSEEDDSERKDTEFNYIRVVYQGESEPYEVPAKLAFADENDNAPSLNDGVEPLGFDINLPGIYIENKKSTKDNPSSLKDFNLYFTAKLIGVKPLFENDKNRAMHYNLTEVAAGLNIQGNVLGEIIEKDTEVELKDTAEMTFTAKFINAANFYAKSLWPDKNDYFVAKAGVKAPKKQLDLFKYSLLEDQRILISASKDKDGNVTDEVYGQADYFEIDVLGVGTNRYEVFEQEGKYALRSCFIDSNVEEIKKEASKICRASEQVAKSFSLLDDLIYSDEKYFDSFAITGYGTYKPEIPDNVDWGDGSWDGIYEASFSQIGRAH